MIDFSGYSFINREAHNIYPHQLMENRYNQDWLLLCKRTDDHDHWSIRVEATEVLRYALLGNKIKTASVVFFDANDRVVAAHPVAAVRAAWIGIVPNPPVNSQVGNYYFMDENLHVFPRIRR